MDLTRYILVLMALILSNMNIVNAATAVTDPAYEALLSGNVFADPHISKIDQGKLEQAALQGQGNPHTFVKIAVIRTLPAGYKTLEQYADSLAKKLMIGRNGLIIADLNVSNPRLVIETDGLPASEKALQERRFIASVIKNPTTGLQALSSTVASDINIRDYGSATVIWVLFLIALVAAIIHQSKLSRVRRSALREALLPVHNLRTSVQDGIGALERSEGAIVKASPEFQAVHGHLCAAESKYEQSVKILNTATELTDIARAEALLTQAAEEIESGRSSMIRESYI